MRFLKYLLHALGLFILLAIIFGYHTETVTLPDGSTTKVQAPPEGASFLICAVPIGYIITRLCLDSNTPADRWRKRFDGDTNAAAILQHVRSLNPVAIEFIYNYPPGEQPVPQQPPQDNPMYPGATHKPAPTPTFQPQMRLKDATGKLLQAFLWPYTDTENSMRYFPWWLEHQLGPGQWNIGILKESGSTGTPHYGLTLSANSDGAYYKPTLYSDDIADRPYGRYMCKKM